MNIERGGGKTLAWGEDLSAARAAMREAGSSPLPVVAADQDERRLNPTLRVHAASWRNLLPLVDDRVDRLPDLAPEPGAEVLLFWRVQKTGELRSRVAGKADLLALKLVAEGIEPEAAAAVGELDTVGVEDVLRAAEDQGLLLSARSRIRRSGDFPRGGPEMEGFLEAGWFTLQWHLTQACDLHCAHCYDRSDRSAMNLGAALGVIEDLRDFCAQRRVRGAISFSGGNPLLYPHFIEVYRAAADAGFPLAILGNPAPPSRIEELLAVRKPWLFQISLEGLPEHNDQVRGAGHFDRSVAFLALLKELGVSTMVMLTLTADNISQVLPLTRRLRGLVDDFHFNRLSMTGEGAKLRLPGRERYERFLEEYLSAAAEDPALGIKDNLINILRRRRGEAPFGGCTGHGCGAAFNFLALLPDGEAHACRKLPSPVGNIIHDGLAAVYESPAAIRYRDGCAACRDCGLRPVCGGCLAVASGFGLDPFGERDPMCFVESE